jgi:hypothetical protein
MTTFTSSNPKYLSPVSAPMPDPSEGPSAREAYDRLIEEIRSVPDTDLIAINIDVPTVVATVRGVIGKAGELRGGLVRLPDFDTARFDKLGDYALALEYAHMQYLAAATPAEPLDQLVTEGTAMRKVLLADASTLAAHGIIDGQRLKEIRSSTGYLDLACDLQTLVAILRANWDAVDGKMPLAVADLDRAELVGVRLVDAVGAHTQTPAGATAAADIRRRAFALMVRTYDETRRAASYLRWKEGDVDEILPSLYAARWRRRPSGASAASELPAASAATAVPAPSVGEADAG